MSHAFRFALRSARTEVGSVWRDKARRAEDLGYSTFLMSDHVAGPGPAMEGSGHPPGGLAVIPALMALAGATQTLRVGCRVMCIDYHHPVVLAKELATIDLLSDGRLEVGLGAGWLTAEYEALGIPFDPAGERIERLGEAVTVMKQLFGDDQVSFHGRHYDVDGFTGEPKPVQRPHPPIAIGGGGRKVLELAGRVADIVSFNYDNRSGLLGSDGVQRSTAERTARKVQWVRDGAGDRFDSVELEVGVNYFSVTSDAHAFATRAGEPVGLSADEMLVHPHALIGSVDAICDELVRRREAYGISYVSIHDDHAETFAPIAGRLAGT
jgi:probable F420-dependent oxidoreductase